MIFIDLRQFNQNVATYVFDKNKSKKKIIFTDEQIRKIYHGCQSADISEYEDIPELCKSDTKKQILSMGLSMALTKYKLGDLIELCTEKSRNLKYSAGDIKGVYINKIFIETKAVMEAVSLKPYTDVFLLSSTVHLKVQLLVSDLLIFSQL